jgi:hypothetical protein
MQYYDSARDQRFRALIDKAEAAFKRQAPKPQLLAELRGLFGYSGVKIDGNTATCTRLWEPPPRSGPPCARYRARRGVEVVVGFDGDAARKFRASYVTQHKGYFRSHAAFIDLDEDGISEEEMERVANALRQMLNKGR